MFVVKVKQISNKRILTYSMISGVLEQVIWSMSMIASFLVRHNLTNSLIFMNLNNPFECYFVNFIFFDIFFLPIHYFEPLTLQNDNTSMHDHMVLALKGVVTVLPRYPASAIYLLTISRTDWSYVSHLTNH